MTETLIGVGAAALVGWIGTGLLWGSKTSTRISVVETKQDSFDKWLESIDKKLDRLIEHRR